MNVIANLIAAAGIGLVIWLTWFFSKNDTIPEETEDRRILRFNGFWHVAGYLLFGFAVFLPIFVHIMAAFVNGVDAGVHFVMAGFAVVLALLAGYVWRQMRQGYATVTREGVAEYSPWWGTSKDLDWKDIQEVEIVKTQSGILRGIRLISRGDMDLAFNGAYWSSSAFHILTDAIHAEMKPSQIKTVTQF